MKKFMLLILVMSTVILSGCQSDAEMASYNLSKSADMFEVNRRVIFYNGITGDYMLSIEGLCSIEESYSKTQLEVTCKTGPKSFKKHFLGLSDNVTYFAEQLESISASAYRYRVIFKPQTILPDVEISIGD